MNRLILGDCIEVLKTLPSNSIDSCVTDPPYHLVSVVKRFGKEGSKPAKHGKDGLYSRASKGFMGKEWDGGDISFKPEVWAEVYRVLKPGGHLLAFGGSRTYHRIACAIEDAGFELRDTIQWLYGSGFPKSHNQTGEWEGWGSALKPAYEPITLARKPFKGSIPNNLAQNGVGAINIDACRIPTDDELKIHSASQEASISKGIYGDSKARTTFKRPSQELGRWPTNFLHDGLPDQWARFFYCAKASKADRNEGLHDFESVKTNFAKGTGLKKNGDGTPRNMEETARNPHPTVKPTALMAYLCKLVTPAGGTVLDPFMGSGSTGKAALKLGMKFIGIERDEEYFRVAKARTGIDDKISDLIG